MRAPRFLTIFAGRQRWQRLDLRVTLAAIKRAAPNRDKARHEDELPGNRECTPVAGLKARYPAAKPRFSVAEAIKLT